MNQRSNPIFVPARIARPGIGDQTSEYFLLQSRHLATQTTEFRSETDRIVGPALQHLNLSGFFPVVVVGLQKERDTGDTERAECRRDGGKLELIRKIKFQIIIEFERRIVDV